jgi:hexulose-6-phosphate isomerase
MTPMRMQSPTRREILASAIGAAAFASIAMPATAQPTAPLRRAPKKAVKYGMVAEGSSVLEKFEILRDCGFDGVEMDSPNGLALDEVLAAKEKTGLQIPGTVDSVHWDKPLSANEESVRADGLAALRTAISDCKRYGGTSTLLVPAVVKKDVRYGDAWSRSQSEIRKVLPLLDELEIDLLIENVWNGFLLGPTELARFVDELQHPRVGVHFDPGNLVKFGYPEHWVPILGTRIKKVDVKDFSRGKAGFGVELNEGDTDWPAVMKELRAIGYDGWFTAEMRSGNRAWLKDLASRMDSFLRG